MKSGIIVIFDIGKTNKKLLIFDTSLRLVSEKEENFPLITDEDGFECDDIDLIESWIRKSLNEIARSEEHDVLAVNFTTYGATLAYLDTQGRRVGPVYNYLKPIDDNIALALYEQYGGREEFCRKTASPALGMLNSGLQALWLKKRKPDFFSRVQTILHFPQYLSYLFTGSPVSEHTSIGCHTALWDFDAGTYHSWVSDEKLPFPEPVPVDRLFPFNIQGRQVMAGTGLHDSSASLAPYFAGSTGNFILLSTGTWCINMNPYNSDPLTSDELMRDCLCYLSINREPVKASRVFLGHMHDEAVRHMSYYFKIHQNSFRLIKPDTRLMNKLMIRFEEERIFITRNGVIPALKEEPDLFVFDNFIEGYHLLMVELTDLAVEAINLIIPENDNIETIYVTGGFSRNQLFLKLLASSFPDKKIFTSEIANATALGAAQVTLKALKKGSDIIPDLGLTEIKI